MRCAFEGITSPHTRVRGPNDPVTLALEAYEATSVSPREFRMLDGARELETPPRTGSSFEVREPPDRPAKTGVLEFALDLLSVARERRICRPFLQPRAGCEFVRFQTRFLRLGK